jgi:hypothetical protein
MILEGEKIVWSKDREYFPIICLYHAQNKKDVI